MNDIARIVDDFVICLTCGSRGACACDPWKGASPMAEQFSDVIRRTPDAEKRSLCCWCAKRGQWELPVRVGGLTVYCCSVQCYEAFQEAPE